MKVSVCQTCLSGAGLIPKDNFGPQARHLASNISTILEMRYPNGKWKVDIVSCLDICPSSQIAMALDLPNSADGELLVVSEEATIESIIKKCLEKAQL